MTRFAHLFQTKDFEYFSKLYSWMEEHPRMLKLSKVLFKLWLVFSVWAYYHAIRHHGGEIALLFKGDLTKIIDILIF